MIVDIYKTPKQYNIIYADPPWQYEAWSNDEGKVSHKYDTMSLQDLSKLPVKKIAANSCVLFMWATFPCLSEALQLITKWGFTYKTCAFTWVKLDKSGTNDFFGLGYYTRSNAEICLIATKGDPLERQSKSVKQVIMTPVEEHSKKPNQARERIVELFGDLPRIELFARQQAEGWDCWGNEVDNRKKRRLV